jgi:hypothetical protein
MLLTQGGEAGKGEADETDETNEPEETEEWAFQADTFRASLWSIRFGAALSTIMFGLFGLARSAPALFVVCGVEVRLPLNGLMG